jgi:hypothetical protein
MSIKSNTFTFFVGDVKCDRNTTARELRAIGTLIEIDSAATYCQQFINSPDSLMAFRANECYNNCKDALRLQDWQL